MRVHATLTLKVVVDDADSEALVGEQLMWAVNHLANQGDLTGSSGGVVDTWDATVITKEEKSCKT